MEATKREGINYRSRTSNLGTTAPTEQLSVTFPDEIVSAQASVYVTVEGRDPFDLVRFDLLAETHGIRSPIASAFVAPPFQGLIIVATGVCCDGFHVQTQAIGRDPVVTIALAARACCSAFRVDVPAALQNPPAPGILLEPPPAPWGRGDGLYSLLAGAAAAETIPIGRRVRRAWAHATAAGATLTVAPLGRVIQVPVGDAGAEIIPGGNLVSVALSPVILTFAGTDSYIVELVA